MIKIINLIVVLTLLLSCSPPPKTTPVKDKKQLNITILLDMSDRIDTVKYPSTLQHFERDIKIVDILTNIFKEDIKESGLYGAKGKIKIIFNPVPKISNIDSIASDFKIDLSKQNTKQKKEIYKNISESFTRNLNTIYSEVIKSGNYVGSDIWRFFKNDVLNNAVSNDSIYRNILVILTDGYLYHDNSKKRKENRSMYLTHNYIKSIGLGANDWEKKFETGDYGYICSRKDLENLDILVLEISPLPKATDDEDVIKAYLEKWFREMKVNKFKLLNSDIPTNNKETIKEFINK